MEDRHFMNISDFERDLPFYLHGVGSWHDQEPKERPDGTLTYHWIQCHGGSGELFVNGKKYTVRERQGMFFYPDNPLGYYPVNRPWLVDWISFGGRCVEKIIGGAGVEKCGVFYVSNPDVILSKMRKILNMAKSNKLLKELECSALVYEFLIELSRYISTDSGNSIDNKYNKFQTVLQYIDQNYQEPVSLKALASTIQVTPEHLCRLFKKIVRLRPFEYVTHVRIGKSKELLLSRDDLSIAEIAAKVGYENVSYFCTVFKKSEGLSPGSFKGVYGTDPVFKKQL